MNLLVRFRVMDFGKALLSTQDLSRCGWETVDMLTLSGKLQARITVVKKRCAWYLRAKLKPHRRVTIRRERIILELMSLDRGAGMRPVEERGSSSSSARRCRGECACEKACGTIVPNSNRPIRAHGQWACGEILCCDGEQVQERSRRQDSLRAAQGAQVHASTATF